MIRVFVRHPVADDATWRQHDDDFDAERRGMGVMGDAVCQALDDSNDVTVWHDRASSDEAKAFASSPRVREVMAGAGVTATPAIWFTTEV